MKSCAFNKKRLCALFCALFVGLIGLFSFFPTNYLNARADNTTVVNEFTSSNIFIPVSHVLKNSNSNSYLVDTYFQSTPTAYNFYWRYTVQNGFEFRLYDMQSNQSNLDIYVVEYAPSISALGQSEYNNVIIYSDVSAVPFIDNSSLYTNYSVDYYCFADTLGFSEYSAYFTFGFDNDDTTDFKPSFNFFNKEIISVGIGSRYNYFSGLSSAQLLQYQTNSEYLTFYFNCYSSSNNNRVLFANRQYYLDSYIENGDFYKSGYDNGYRDGNSAGYNNGLIDGSNISNQQEYNRGYQDGLLAGNDYTFLGLFSAVVDAPVQALSGLLGFEILGVNLFSLFQGLITIAIIIFVIRLVL